MLASEARAIGARWLEERLLTSTPPGGVRSVYVMGSLAPLGDAEEFDEVASDIDLAIVVDPSVLPIDSARYPDGTFSTFRGCLIQANFVPQVVLESEERLFGMIGLGCNLRHGRILLDPDGALEVARSKVLEHWSEPRWRAHRTQRSISFTRSCLEATDEQREGPEGLKHLCNLVTQLAGLVPIAHGTTPTHRRALVLAHTLLEPLGRLDLHERMLTAIGADDVDEVFVSACTEDALAAIRIEQRYDDAATDPSDDSTAVASGRAGLGQLVAQGYQREAVLPALDWLASISLVVRDRASEADRAALDTLVQRRLQARPDALVPSTERQAMLLDLFEEVTRFCETTAQD